MTYTPDGARTPVSKTYDTTFKDGDSGDLDIPDGATISKVEVVGL